MSIGKKYLDYQIYFVGYILSCLFSQMHFYYLSGGILIAVGIILYVINIRRTKQIADLRGLFSASWISGEGIACLKLSKLQTDWKATTWICFFLAYVCFIFAYDYLDKCSEKENIQKKDSVYQHATQAKKILACIVILAIISCICFLIEVVIVGFIPLFSPEPHAYSYFHVSGVHYFTISCILIPALTVLYMKIEEKVKLIPAVLLGICNIWAVSIPILCVSRFQLLFAVGFAAVTYVMLYQHITWRMMITAAMIIIPLYVLLTIARRHDVSYLNSIFEMKNKSVPIFVTQPYIYVANNYENFNCLVRDLTTHTFGIRMLFPLFALTGLKFLLPQLIASPIYITKKELTTLTMFYDSYYDFGIIGVILLAVFLGAVAKKLTDWVKKSDNPISYLFYGQMAIYLGLSFFTTWFSNPTTWFWIVLTIIIYLYVNEKSINIRKKGKRKCVKEEKLLM